MKILFICSLIVNVLFGAFCIHKFEKRRETMDYWKMLAIAADVYDCRVILNLTPNKDEPVLTMAEPTWKVKFVEVEPRIKLPLK